MNQQLLILNLKILLPVLQNSVAKVVNFFANILFERDVLKTLKSVEGIIDIVGEMDWQKRSSDDNIVEMLGKENDAVGLAIKIF